MFSKKTKKHLFFLNYVSHGGLVVVSNKVWQYFPFCPVLVSFFFLLPSWFVQIYY